MIKLKILDEVPRVRHAFFTRRGGVSQGLFASLNCGLGSGDDPERVRRNRAIAAAALDLPEAQLLTGRQVHGVEVVRVERPWAAHEPPQADALVTDRPGLALGVLTADCAPILLLDPTARVIGAAHGGWRGALAGVAEAAVAAMEELGAHRPAIRAAIGPCISLASYEVGPEFPQPFLAEEPASGRFFTPAPRPGHSLFNLAGYLETRLARAGIGAVEIAGNDTAAEPERFFSYRRACLKGEPVYGRGLSAIGLAA
jgi:YfiH family protein